MTEPRKLRVFLCHASQDKPVVRDLYQRLNAEGWIDPWLDEEKLFPGQDWDLEIYKAIRAADVIIVCLSKTSIQKEGYVQKEFRRALDFAKEKPEGTIYIIPLRLDDCSPPIRFQQWQWADYFTELSFKKLIVSLKLRVNKLEIKYQDKNVASSVNGLDKNTSLNSSESEFDLYRFVEIDLGNSTTSSSSFWIAKYPVTNKQYERFLNSEYFAFCFSGEGFQKFDFQGNYLGRWQQESLEWLRKSQGEKDFYKVEKKIEPRFWQDPILGKILPDNPVVGISWFEANAYCKWLKGKWSELSEEFANPTIKPRLIRLPMEREWIRVAGGDNPPYRYPWDLPNKITSNTQIIIGRSNVMENNLGHTTPVNNYLDGASPYGVMDMAGNIWEWQANFFDKDLLSLSLRGGSWKNDGYTARVTSRESMQPAFRFSDIGFRVALFSDG